MSKRFTETKKWQDDWFLSLSNDNRIIWIYLLDNCSIAGIWEKGFKALNFFCNTNISENDFKTIFKDKCFEIDDKYFFIPNYLKHQYPSGLTSNKPMIVSVLKELERFNDYTIIKESLSNDKPIIKVKVRVKERVKVKEEEGDCKGEDIKKSSGVKDFLAFCSQQFNQKFSEILLIDYGRDGMIMKKLLSVYGLDKLKELWGQFMQSDDSFIQKTGYSIPIFKTQINKLLTAGKTASKPQSAMGMLMQSIKEDEDAHRRNQKNNVISGSGLPGTERKTLEE